MGYILNIPPPPPPPVTFLEHCAVNTGDDFPLHLSDLGRAVAVMFTLKTRQETEREYRTHTEARSGLLLDLIFNSMFSDTLTGTHTSFPLTHLYGCRHIY